MKISLLFSIIISYLLIALSSAKNKGDVQEILDGVDHLNDVDKTVVDDLKHDLDDCLKKEDHKSDFLDCVDHVLKDYDGDDELSQHQRHQVKNKAKKFAHKVYDDKKGNRNLRRAL